MAGHVASGRREGGREGGSLNKWQANGHPGSVSRMSGRAVAKGDSQKSHGATPLPSGAFPSSRYRQQSLFLWMADHIMWCRVMLPHLMLFYWLLFARVNENEKSCILQSPFWEKKKQHILRKSFFFFFVITSTLTHSVSSISCVPSRPSSNYTLLSVSVWQTTTKCRNTENLSDVDINEVPCLFLQWSRFNSSCTTWKIWEVPPPPISSWIPSLLLCGS